MFHSTLNIFVYKTHDRMLRYGGSIILSIAYDINPKSDTDIYLVIADQALVGLNFAATPGSFLVDVMPFRESESFLRLAI